jgi:hypothetical protein
MSSVKCQVSNGRSGYELVTTKSSKSSAGLGTLTEILSIEEHQQVNEDFVTEELRE